MEFEIETIRKELAATKEREDTALLNEKKKDEMLRDLTAQLEQYARNCALKDEEVNEKLDFIQFLNSDLKETKDQMQDLRHELKQAEGKKEDVERELSNIQQQLQAIEERHIIMSFDISDDFKREMDQKDRQISELQQTIDKLIVDNTKLNQALVEKADHLSSTRLDITLLKETNSRLDEEITNLLQMLQASMSMPELELIIN